MPPDPLRREPARRGASSRSLAGRPRTLWLSSPVSMSARFRRAACIKAPSSANSKSWVGEGEQAIQAATSPPVFAALNLSYAR